MMLMETLLIMKHKNAEEKAVAADIPKVENNNMDKPSRTPRPMNVTGSNAERVIKGVVKNMDSGVVASKAETM